MEKKVPYTGNNSADLIRDGKDVSYQPSTISLIKHCSPQKELSKLQNKFERFFHKSFWNTPGGIPQIVVHTAFGNWCSQYLKPLWRGCSTKKIFHGLFDGLLWILKTGCCKVSSQVPLIFDELLHNFDNWQGIPWYRCYIDIIIKMKLRIQKLRKVYHEPATESRSPKV